MADAGSHVPDDRPERAGSAPGERPGRQASRVNEAEGPTRRKRAKALCILFTAFACLVSAAIWWTSDSLDAVDYVFIFGGPIAFGALAYFIGRHVSDDAYGA